MENEIYPEKLENKLPKYVSISSSRNKQQLCYDKRVDGITKNLKMVLPDEYNINEQLEIFNEKIKAKYEGEDIVA